MENDNMHRKNEQSADFFARKLKSAEALFLKASRSGTDEEQREALELYQQFENINLALHTIEDERQKKRHNNEKEGEQ